MNKLLVICGPTAAGKTAIGLQVAKQLDGEIISADSRQVYKGMDIGTGKDLNQKSKIKNQNAKLYIKNRALTVGYREKEAIPIWLVDIVKPDYVFNVGEYKHLAKLVISDIQGRGKLPIVVGGSGLYIKAILEPLKTLTIPPNKKLREELDTISVEQLQKRLERTDPLKYLAMNESDQRNPRRLIRAIEVAEWQKDLSVKTDTPHEAFDALIIGITAPLNVLRRFIDQRVEKRVEAGIINEIQQLLQNGYDWNIPSMSGLGYREWQGYFRGNNRVNEVVTSWKNHEVQYAKRQMTWFRKQPNIHWFDISNFEQRALIIDVVRKWLRNS